tara:strand:+ start:764 stop:931 length:168 start_codon:yes stop_codon:yes gene_type:complete
MTQFGDSSPETLFIRKQLFGVGRLGGNLALQGVETGEEEDWCGVGRGLGDCMLQV